MFPIDSISMLMPMLEGFSVEQLTGQHLTCAVSHVLVISRVWHLT
jgi:hypothetical protein